MRCLIVQPIHPAGLALLERAGITPVTATAPDMATIAQEIAGCEAVITRNAGLSAAAIAAAPGLRVIGNHGVGTNAIDLTAAAQAGIPVVFTPLANVQSVAELAIAQMLALAKRLRECDRAVREGNFAYRFSRDFAELQGKSLLVVGFGAIGRRTAQIAARAFDMRVLVHRRTECRDPSLLSAAGV